MILQCPQCETTYRVKLESIPAGKTHIKCKNCQASFHLPTLSEDAAAEPRISIQCDSCGTKYRVKQSRFSEKTSKVKCTKCESVFEIQNDKDVKLPEKSIPEDESNDQSPTSSLLSDAEKAYFEAVTLDHEDTEVFPEFNLDFSEKEALFMNAASPLQKSRKVQSSTPPQLPVDQELMDLSELPDPSNPNSENPPLNEDVSSQFPSDLEEGMPQFEIPSSLSLRDRSTLPIVEEAPSEGEINWGRMTIKLLIFMVVFFGAAGSVAYLALKEPSTFSWFMKSPTAPIRFTVKLSSKEVQNFTSRQTLIVVEGKLQNLLPSEDQVSWLRLKGLAFDENRQVIETSIVYAGNILSTKELSSWSLEKIKKFYDYNSGRNNSNFELKEKQEVPFQIVFFDSANILKDASAKLVSYVSKNETVYVRSGD
ncbi:MAG: zinc-ribbon domain-containing protein [SAR324 cluster bacterium]|nr:zinc-ribbon domain-containing protein [SAR324 cluster bacterium]